MLRNVSSSPKKAQTILHVTDFHIGAPYGGIPVTPPRFLEITRYAKTLGDFCVGAQLPDSSPLCILTRRITKAGSIALTDDMIEFINQPENCDDEMKRKVGFEFHRMLLGSAKGKPVYEVLGNHERVKPYERDLENLEDNHPNYHVSTSHFLIGDALFIHGDTDLTPHSMLGERAYVKRDTERARHTDDHTVHAFSNRHVPGLIQDMPGLHAVLEKILSPLIPSADPLLYTPRNQAALLSFNLDVRLKDVFSRANHVFSGHNHMPCTSLEYDFQGRTIHFHNGGATLGSKSRGFHPLMITMQGDVVQHVEPAGSKQQGRGR